MSKDTLNVVGGEELHSRQLFEQALHVDIKW